MTETLQRTEYYYSSSNALQNVAVWQFPSDQIKDPQPGTKKYWLIFIHGGAWRDPRATFNEATPTIDALLQPSSAHHLPHAAARIAGLASLNYRLSPHPSFSQSPSHTPVFASRAARHPDHLLDVRAGLRFLQVQFGFGAGEYVLFGHSAGAMLAFQTLLGGACLTAGEEKEEGDVGLPAAVVGFEGIYDLKGLNARMGGSYAGFIEAAFGRDEKLGEGSSWDAASPATARGAIFGRWNERGGKIAVLAHSPDDELVDMTECDTMEARLTRDGVRNVRVYKDLEGGHFDVLNDGSFARILKMVWMELEELDKA